MKKFIALILSLTVVLTLAGCGINGKEILHIDSYEWKMRTVMTNKEVSDEDTRVVAVGEKDELYPNASIVDMTLIATDGKITLTDVTNDKTYTGSYKTTEETSKAIIYEVVIDGVTGYASASPTEYYNGTEIPTLPISLGEYSIYFIPKE